MSNKKKKSKESQQTPQADYRFLYYGMGFLVLGLGIKYFGYDESKLGNYLRMIFLWIAVVLNVMHILRFRANRKK
jgi:cyanate permease